MRRKRNEDPLVFRGLRRLGLGRLINQVYQVSEHDTTAIEKNRTGEEWNRLVLLRSFQGEKFNNNSVKRISRHREKFTCGWKATFHKCGLWNTHPYSLSVNSDAARSLQ